MKYCVCCGQQLVDEAKFCVKCGKPAFDVGTNSEEVNNENIAPDTKSEDILDILNSARDENTNSNTNSSQHMPNLNENTMAESSNTIPSVNTNTTVNNNVCQNNEKKILEEKKKREEELKKLKREAFGRNLSIRTLIGGLILISTSIVQFLVGIFGMLIADFGDNPLGVLVFFVIFVLSIINLVSGIKDIVYSVKVRAFPYAFVDHFMPLASVIFVLILNLLFGGVISIVGQIYYIIFVRGFVMLHKKDFY